MATAQVPAIEINKLNTFIGQFVSDLGAAVHAGMLVVSEKLGLYKALAGGPMKLAQLAAMTKTDEREAVTKAGFNRFRQATETPFNIVYEARP